MIFVTGGAAQGKLRYVRETFGITGAETADAADGSVCAALLHTDVVVDAADGTVFAALLRGGSFADTMDGMACAASRRSGGAADVCGNAGSGIGVNADHGVRRKLRCVVHYQLLIRALLSEGVDPEQFTAALIDANPMLIIIMEEIGCGIVPLEKEERLWREACGRCGCVIAARADAVVRLVCGIPTVIKGRMPADVQAE